MNKKFRILLLTGLVIAVSLGLSKKVQSYHPSSSLLVKKNLVSGTDTNGDKPNLILAQANEQAIAQSLANNYLQKIPVSQIPNALTNEQAKKIQGLFVEQLMPQLGKVIGYKAGLTNPEAQKRFQADKPVQGVLLEKMLLPSGATVPSNFGIRTFVEGDLIVRVSSDKINQAKTPEEVLDCLDAVIPFLELPDLVYQENIKLNLKSLVAINLGARLGILGEPIPLSNTQDWETRLSKLKVIILDRDGKELGTGEGSNLLGDPLKVVLWLRDNLQEQGKSLKPGDLLSLGTITKMIAIEPGTTIRAKYLGLTEEPVEISVKFN